jgi:hypothetical protein
MAATGTGRKCPNAEIAAPPVSVQETSRRMRIACIKWSLQHFCVPVVSGSAQPLFIHARLNATTLTSTPSASNTSGPCSNAQ